MDKDEQFEMSFQLFTSLRYDPLLLTSAENSSPTLNFVMPSPFYMLRYHRDRMLEAAQHFDFHAVAKLLEDGPSLHSTLLQKVTDWTTQGNQNGPLKLRLLFDKSATLCVELSPVPPVPLSTLYPSSFDPPDHSPPPHPAQTPTPTFSPLTGGPLTLGPSDSLPAQTSPPSPPWLIKLDTHPTPSTPFTLLKTTHRTVYTSSRARSLPTPTPTLSEVMLYNECSELTEGSMTSLYLFRGGRWVTPPVGVPAGDFDGETLKGGEADEGELRRPFAGRWGHSVRSAKVGAGGQRGTTRRWALGRGMCMEEPVGVGTVEVGEGVWVSNGVRGFGFGKVVA
ncbi:hypothetical protein EJ04DRAFT_496272 [Polyplosphaeria fusca]|uniref:Aminodeoxychorismate lyase n=1 Tax=Polyplosphaeria fusca TaxID=682080 RepID=A0A9P4QXV5_9PLEO|nr:hypothetical protein EJ04DRAFT_496272 [Polyplosphaeria fusca]